MSYTYSYGTYYIPAGTLVRRAGTLSKRAEGTVVTAKRVEPARNGKTRVFWKSNGVIASALV